MMVICTDFHRGSKQAKHTVLMFYAKNANEGHCDKTYLLLHQCHRKRKSQWAGTYTDVYQHLQALN